MTKVFYAEANYSDEEIDAVIKVLRENRLALMCGENVRALEGQVAKLFNKKFGLMTNSGSSANLIAVQSLNLKKGTKVLTPALTFSTTISPLVQSELIPLFIDVERETMQIDINKLKQATLENVSAICVPNLIGRKFLISPKVTILRLSKTLQILLGINMKQARKIGLMYPQQVSMRRT